MKFKIGDKVKIINYGHLLWHNKKSGKYDLSFPIISENEDMIVFDMSPELIGKPGIIINSNTTQGKNSYAIDGPSKTAWYNEDQLEFIKA